METRLGGFVVNACKNESCARYMIVRRYPTRLDCFRGHIVVCYFSLAPQCPSCNSFLNLE